MLSRNGGSKNPTHDLKVMTLVRYELIYRQMGHGEATPSAPRNAPRQEGAGEAGRTAEEVTVRTRACRAEAVRWGGQIVVELAGSGGGQSSGGVTLGRWGMDDGLGDFGRGRGDCGREGREREVHKEGRVTWWQPRQQGGWTLDMWSLGEDETPKSGGEIVDAAGGDVQREGRATWRWNGGQGERTLSMWEFWREQGAELGTSNAR